MQPEFGFEPFAGTPWSIVIVLAGAVLAMLFLILILVALLRRRRPGPVQPPPARPWIDVATLDATPVPADAAKLELYGIPVRLSVAVVAPVGREGTMPPQEQLAELFEHLIPDFTRVVSSHRPLLKFWPGQLSSQGLRTRLPTRSPYRVITAKAHPGAASRGSSVHLVSNTWLG